jgi:tetratricopeptide (TPR) repeat protein
MDARGTHAAARRTGAARAFGAGALAVWVLVAAASAAGEAAWTKVTTPHFTILTPTGAATAREWALELEQFRRGLQTIVPVPAERLRPVTVVLFARARDMEPYLPLENGKPARLGGFFVRSDEINTIMLSLGGERDDTRHTVYHEAVHWHLSAFEGPMPLWLGEGLAEVYATFELGRDGTYAFGNPIPFYLALLRREAFMPLPRLFGTGRDSLLYNEGTRASIFYAQAWAFVHYLFFGEGSPGPGAILNYLKLLRTTDNPDDAFAQALGASHGEIERRLAEYVRRGRYRVHRYARTTDELAGQLKAVPAQPADLELAKGALLLGARNPEAAEPHLWRAVALAPEDPRGWELLGNIAIGRRDYPEAVSALGKAVAAGSTNYLVHHNLAVAHFPPPAVAGFAFGGGDAAEMDAAAKHYRAAIRLAPAHVGAYEGLAGLMHGMQTFDPEDAARLARGLTMAPGNATLEAGLAVADLRAGRSDEARARLERIVRSGAEGDRGVEFARKVLASERLKAELGDVDRLARQGRYDAARAIVRRLLDRESLPAQRAALERSDTGLRDLQTLAAAVERANRGDTAGARQELEALLAREPGAAIRADAERLRREIARHEERSGTGGEAGAPRR